MQVSQRKAGILLNYINEAVKILTALVYTPVMLRLLGQSEYGLYQLVSSTVAYLSLLSFGFASAYVRYFSRYQVQKDNQGIAKLNGMFLLIFCSISALCLLCGSVMVTNARAVFGNGLTGMELEKAKLLMAILVVNMALTFPNSVFDCYVTAHEQFLFQKLLRLAQSILNPFVTLPLLLLGYGSVAIVAVSTLLTVGLLLANIGYCRKKLQMRFSFRGLQFSLLKEMWIFTFFIFLTQIIDQVNWSVDKFLLGRMSGTAAVAVYGIGGQINSLYIGMSTAVANIFIPKVNQIVAYSDDNAELTRLMVKVGRVQAEILFLVMIGFAVFGKPFIHLWAGNAYEDAYWVALLLIIPVTVPLVQNLGIEIQRAKNKHQVRSLVYTGLALLNILLSIFLIRRWGCIGAAAGTAVALLAGNGIFMNWYYQTRLGLNMRYFWKEILSLFPALVLSGCCGIVFLAFIKIDTWLELLGCVLVFTLIYGIAMWKFGLNEFERKLAYKVLKKPRLVKND